MSDHPVVVRELAAWGFDIFPARGNAAMMPAPRRTSYSPEDPRHKQHLLLHDPVLLAQRQRPDLLLEMQGLTWDLAVVDLRRLLAFQRRLSFDPQAPALPTASTPEAANLLRATFGPPKPVQYKTVILSDGQLELHSTDPNFHLRLSSEPGTPAIPSSGSPFLEVAEYRERWFLRDGYHRAYHLLRAGISIVPAVVIHAQTLAELGADQSWFFQEDVLFSHDPPRVMDFLDDTLTCEYTRPRFTKTVRLTATTSYEPTDSEEQR